MSTLSNPRTEATRIGDFAVLVLALIAVAAIGFAIAYGAHVVRDFTEQAFNTPTTSTFASTR